MSPKGRSRVADTGCGQRATSREATLADRFLGLSVDELPTPVSGRRHPHARGQHRPLAARRRSVTASACGRTSRRTSRPRSPRSSCDAGAAGSPSRRWPRPRCSRPPDSTTSSSPIRFSARRSGRGSPPLPRRSRITVNADNAEAAARTERRCRCAPASSSTSRSTSIRASTAAACPPDDIDAIDELAQLVTDAARPGARRASRPTAGSSSKAPTRCRSPRPGGTRRTWSSTVAEELRARGRGVARGHCRRNDERDGRGRVRRGSPRSGRHVRLQRPDAGRVRLGPARGLALTIHCTVVSAQSPGR